MAEVRMDYHRTEDPETSRKKLAPIVEKENIVSTTQTLSQKFKSAFIKEDVHEVCNYIFKDLVIPGLQGLLLNGLSMMFTGQPLDNGLYNRSRSSYYEPRRSNYRDYYNRSNSYKREEPEDDFKVDYKNIVLKNRDSAERIVDALRDRIREGYATVGDLLDLVGVDFEYTDQNYGWDREGDIGIKRVSRGFLIDVKDAKYIRR